MKPHESALVEVFSGNPTEAEMIKELLEENGIMATIRNQFMGTIAPWQVSPGGHEPSKVEVLETDKERALVMIQEFSDADRFDEPNLD
jgi:hypothetical protein